MASFRRNKIGSGLLLALAFFFFALPALIGLCHSESKMAMGHDCCGSKVLCHQQIQRQPCCESQGSAPPTASPLLALAAPFALVAAAPAQDLDSAFLSLASLVPSSPSANPIFLLKHSFLC